MKNVIFGPLLSFFLFIISFFGLFAFVPEEESVYIYLWENGMNMRRLLSFLLCRVIIICL
jgi:hypothetical protein